MVTVADLKAIAGTGETPLMAPICAAFNKYAAQYSVTNSKRITQCLANICVETGGFRVLEEDLNYSADRLREVWPNRFPSDAVAQQYAHSPQKLANFVYGGRMGNDGPNDGWNYRGSGPGQVTGKSEFRKVQDETGLPVISNPALLREPDAGTQATLILWKKYGLNEMADADQTDAIRKRWNGGTNGLGDVRKYVARALHLNLRIDGAPNATATPQAATPAASTAPPATLPVSPPTAKKIVPAAAGAGTAAVVVAAGGLAAYWHEFTHWLWSFF